MINMKTNVRETSIENHYINEASLINENLEAKIAAFVKLHGPVTRRQIAESIGIDTATCSGRVCPLVKGGVLIEDELKRPCPITGRNVIWVRHRDSAKGQIDMFGGLQ